MKLFSLSLNSLKHSDAEELFFQFKKMFEIEKLNFCLGHFETLKLKLYGDVVSKSAFFFLNV